MRRIARFVALGYFVIVILAAVLQVAGVARFAAPFNLVPAPVRPPIVVNILFSPEQREWLTATAQQFAESGPTVGGRPIQIVLQEYGTQPMIDGIVQGRLKPTAVIPTDSRQLTRLSQGWTARYPGQPLVATGGTNTPQPLTLSPLVLVGWGDRIDALFPPGGQDIWRQLHDSGAKFGHATPPRASSGIETLILLAYTYHNKSQGLTVDDVRDPGFQQWLGEIESKIVDRPFKDSTDDLFTAFLQKGRSTYDVVVVYEHQAIGRLQSRGLRVLYPPATTLSDHPFAVLGASWIKPEEQEAARLFRDFLLGTSAQRLARQYGFRPAVANVTLQESDSTNPFPAAFDAGVQQGLPGTVAAPPPEVLDALLQVWQQVSG